MDERFGRKPCCSLQMIFSQKGKNFLFMSLENNLRRIENYAIIYKIKTY
jgi:hypothetical protein